MTTIDIANKIFALGTVLGQIGVLLGALYLVFFCKKQPVIVKAIGKYALLCAFIVALVSMSGSLFYSQIAGFAPCQLCWFQRFFMYPLVILLLIAIIRQSSKIIDYALSLSVAGFLISLYHNYIYYYDGGLNVFCKLGGAQVSCIKRYVFELGYVTIPLMALTAFASIIVFLIFYKIKMKVESQGIISKEG